MLFLFLPLLLASLHALASPLQPKFTSCLSSFSPVAAGSNLLNVTDVYAEIIPGAKAAQLGLLGDGHDVLRLDLIGVTGAELAGYDNDTNKLATLFTDTHAATFSVYQSTTWLCNSLFPSELPTPYTPFNTTYCPLPAGDFAINVSIPLYHSYALTTLHSRVRIVDTSLEARNLGCYDIHVSPYRHSGWYYDLFLWWPVAVALGFWLVGWGARFVTGWIVGSGVAEYGQKDASGVRLVGAGGPSKREATMRKWGTMIISGLSGERLSVSGGLLRFVTPGVKDVLFHVQYAAMLGMIAVAWPGFAYPILARGAWANLVWNTTLVQGSDASSKRVDAYPSNYTPSAAFQSQISNPIYPLYLEEDAFNPLLELHQSSNGMESFATAVGLRPQDLFGTCLALFLCITAAVVLLSLVLWFIHGLTEYLASGSSTPKNGSPMSKRAALGPSPRDSVGGKESYDQRPGGMPSDGLGTLPTQSTFFTSKSSAQSPLRRMWLRFRLKGEAGAFHSAALYGNLVRLILVFHLPITIFSIYQLCLGSRASIVSRVFAALAFAFTSVLIPAFILYRISRTPTGKLYDATRTLLSLGPMYNIYVEKKQMFRVFSLGASLVMGIVVGAGQGSGLAQAVILVVVELLMLIVPGVWYPWGEGASMGAPNAFLGALRLASAVLVLMLSEELSMSETAADWITYALLILQAIIFVFFLVMLLTKIIEGSIRLIGGVHFDESTHPLDGGIFAAIMDLDCLNPVRGGKAAERRRRKHGSRQLQKNVSAAQSMTTQMMLDRHSMGVTRQPVSDVDTPFLSAYPMAGHYPPLGPPPIDRRSSESRSDERPGEANIMDAWRPAPVMTGTTGGYVAPGTYAPTVGSPTSPPPDFARAASGSSGQGQGPARGFSVIRGGRADFQNPYDVIQGSGPSRDAPIPVPAMQMPTPTIRVSQVAQRPMSPPHSRQKSSSAVIELSTPPVQPVGLPPAGGAGYPPGPSQGMRADNNHMRPPALAIPKRRSLNDLKNESESSPTSQYSDSQRGKKKGKKNKRRSAGWFHRGEDSMESASEESDDEPGPSRRKTRKAALRASGMREPAPFEDVSRLVEEERQPGWRRVLGLGRRKSLDDLAEQARDENKARKAALATESGALFAGVEAPPSPAVTPKKKGFVVSRRSGERPGPSPTSPTSPTASQRAAAGQFGGQQQQQQPASSFKVKRMGQQTPAPTPLLVTPNSPVSAHPGGPSPVPSDGARSAASVTFGEASRGGNGGTSAKGAAGAGAAGAAVGSEPKRSFRVIRPANPASPASQSGNGFKVNRQPSPLQSPTSPQNASSSNYFPAQAAAQAQAEAEGQHGYPPSSFVPIGRVTSGDAPARPTKDPRRSSESYRRE
ncbi:hypothetical protein IAT38_004364 [Cryptococcus sp. DSM 104549]